ASAGSRTSAATPSTLDNLLVRVGIAKPDPDCLAVRPDQRLEESHRRAGLQSIHQQHPPNLTEYGGKSSYFICFSLPPAAPGEWARRGVKWRNPAQICEHLAGGLTA